MASNPFNPVAFNDLMDVILAILRVVMRFFIYPGLIVMWVWTGFSFVLAQGAPEALTKAKRLLVWAIVSTLVIVMIQGFLVVVQGTLKKVFPASATVKQPYDSSNSQVLGGVSRSSPEYCRDKVVGTVCEVIENGTKKVGTCFTKATGPKSCYAATEGTPCVTDSGVGGVIDAQNTCNTGLRPKVGKGGSCRVTGECSSPLLCTGGICQ